MFNKILYENYIQDTNDSISLEEWVLTESKIKKMNSYWDALKRYGIVGLASYLSGDKTLKDSAEGGTLSVPLGLILYAGYRKNSDNCIEKCNNKLCNQKCYLKSCGIVIKEVYAAINNVKTKTQNPKKILKKLDKQLIKWVKRYNKHKIQIKKLEVAAKKQKKNATVQNRYFGKNN